MNIFASKIQKSGRASRASRAGRAIYIDLLHIDTPCVKGEAPNQEFVRKPMIIGSYSSGSLNCAAKYTPTSSRAPLVATKIKIYKNFQNCSNESSLVHRTPQYYMQFPCRVAWGVVVVIPRDASSSCDVVATSDDAVGRCGVTTSCDV